MRSGVAALFIALALAGPSVSLADTQFAVDPEAGNNTFTAVFDAAIGERITAVSSTVGCTLAVDDVKLEGKASCSVPLASIRVDNDETKSEHFRQWATNKVFETEGTFTLCGRKRDDQGPEKIQGTI